MSGEQKRLLHLGFLLGLLAVAVTSVAHRKLLVVHKNALDNGTPLARIVNVE